jgi:hypothetical protein
MISLHMKRDVKKNTGKDADFGISHLIIGVSQISKLTTTEQNIEPCSSLNPVRLSALGDYMSRVKSHTEKLCAAMEESVKNNTLINMTKWIPLCSFDMLQSGTFHYFFNLAHKTMELIAIVSRLV